MATTGILPQVSTDMNIDASTLTMLIGAATSATTDAALKGALLRARGAIVNGKSYHLIGEVLTVQSASRKWMMHTCTVDTCDCEGHAHGRVCWHRALCMVLITHRTMQQMIAALVPVAPSMPQAPKRVYTTEDFDDLYN